MVMEYVLGRSLDTLVGDPASPRPEPSASPARSPGPGLPMPIRRFVHRD